MIEIHWYHNSLYKMFGNRSQKKNKLDSTNDIFDDEPDDLSTSGPIILISFSFLISSIKCCILER